MSDHEYIDMTPNFTVDSAMMCPYSSSDLDALLNIDGGANDNNTNNNSSPQYLNPPRIRNSVSMNEFPENNNNFPSIDPLPTSTSNCSLKSLKRENDSKCTEMEESKRLKTEEVEVPEIEAPPVNNILEVEPDPAVPDNNKPPPKLTYRERREKHEKMVHEENPEYELKTKKVIKDFMPKQMNPLPNGWVQIRHKCNFDFYLHKSTKVVSWSRPYYLGDAPLKAHHIPLTSIPCMYKARLDEQNKIFEENDSNMIVDRTADREAVSAWDFRKYLTKSRFEEEEVSVKIYKDWLPDKYHKQRVLMQRRMKKQQRKDENKERKRLLLKDMENAVKSDENVDSQDHGNDASQENESSDGEIHSDEETTEKIDDLETQSEKSAPTPIQTVVAEEEDDGSGQESGEIVSSEDEKEQETEKPPPKKNNWKVCSNSEDSDNDDKDDHMDENDDDDDDENEQTKKFRPPALLQSTVSVKYTDAKGVVRTWSNQTTKTPQFILNDYCTKVFRANPKYVESATKNDKYPWKVQLELPDGKIYGEGTGVKKKFAKETAIVKTLEMLIPDYKDRSSESQSRSKFGSQKVSDDFFNHLDITNPKSGDFLQTAGQL